MSEKSLFGHFNRSDFFAVLPPGFFAFTAVYSCLAIDFGAQGPSPSLWSILEALATQLQQRPMLLIFLLFACYLLGSVFRALPVNWAEKSIWPFSVKFPYPDVLMEMVDTLNRNLSATCHDPSKMPDVSQGLPMHVFNYWKDVLCVKSTAGFEYYQTFETRVRLFAGIMWAAWVGVFGSLYIFIRSADVTNRAAVSLFIVSFVLLATFASNFHRARRQEARALGLIFIAYSQGDAAQPDFAGGRPQAGSSLE